jgi:hypothetical protein
MALTGATSPKSLQRTFLAFQSRLFGGVARRGLIWYQNEHPIPQ